MTTLQDLDSESPKSTHSFDSSSLGSAERRRVNPESLAERLGPEVVAELERHITPGELEMPSFSVRRGIQVKFNVDRRHIYDFYHSRGLRCLRSERVSRKKAELTDTTDLTRPRSSRSLTVPNYAEPKGRRSSAKPYIPTPKVMRGSRKNTLARSALLSPLTPIQTRLDANNYLGDTCSDSSLSEDTGPSLLATYEAPSPTPTYLSESDSVSSLSTVSSLDSPLSPISDADSEVELASASSSFDFDDSCDSMFEQLTESRGFLSPEEQSQPYSWLDEALGPAEGIQECVGSYRQFMERQRDIYYKPFFEYDGPSVSTQLLKPEPSPVVKPDSLQYKPDAPPASSALDNDDNDMAPACPPSSPVHNSSRAEEDDDNMSLVYPSSSPAPVSPLPAHAQLVSMHVQPVYVPPELVHVPALPPLLPRYHHAPFYRSQTYPSEQTHSGFFYANYDALRAYQIDGAAVRGLWGEGRFHLRAPSVRREW